MVFRIWLGLEIMSCGCIANNKTHGVLFSAKVMHSQRLSEEPLHPWVFANKEGTIICAHCNCMAG